VDRESLVGLDGSPLIDRVTRDVHDTAKSGSTNPIIVSAMSFDDSTDCDSRDGDGSTSCRFVSDMPS